MLLKVVIDSNVYVSGFSSHRGVPARILRAVQDKKFTPIASPNIINEFSRVLRFKMEWKEERIKNAIKWVSKEATMVYLADADILDVVRDPNDNHVIAAAVVGDADLIVSSDKDLYTYKKISGIGISHPVDFARTLNLL